MKVDGNRNYARVVGAIVSDREREGSADIHVPRPRGDTWTACVSLEEIAAVGSPLRHTDVPTQHSPAELALPPPTQTQTRKTADFRSVRNASPVVDTASGVLS